MDANESETRPRPERSLSRSPAKSALRIVLTYTAVAIAWILFSDAAAGAIFTDPDLLMRVQSVKGALFVLVTSALLFVQIRSDFSRLQASSDQLRQSKDRFRRVIDVSPVPMAIFDAAGKVTLANAALTKLLGYTPTDVPDMETWWSTAFPDAVYRHQVMDDWQHEIERSLRAGDAFAPREARIRCKDGTEKFALVSSAVLHPDSLEQVVGFVDITEREQSEKAVLRSREHLAEVLKSVIALLGKVVEARDPYTRGHEEGVARIGRLIAEQMGLSAEAVDWVEVSGLVHDVGKLGVPVDILTKPGQLTSIEFELIKTHPQLGYDILKDIDFGWPVAETVLQHHERMDGSGYPGGVVGAGISMPARILMVADVIEAMAAHRPYRSALGLDAAMDEITSHPDKFDPAVIEACLKLHQAGRIEV